MDPCFFCDASAPVYPFWSLSICLVCAQEGSLRYEQGDPRTHRLYFLRDGRRREVLTFEAGDIPPAIMGQSARLQKLKLDGQLLRITHGEIASRARLP